MAEMSASPLPFPGITSDESPADAAFDSMSVKDFAASAPSTPEDATDDSAFDEALSCVREMNRKSYC